VRHDLATEHFDLAIISYGWNDANESTVTDAERLRTGRGNRLRAALHQSRLYLWLADLLLRWTGQRVDSAPGDRLRVPLDEYREALVEIVFLLRRIRASPPAKPAAAARSAPRPRRCGCSSSASAS